VRDSASGSLGPTPAAKIRRSEWRWVAAWTAGILAFTAIPYLVGWLVAFRTGQTFGGFVIGAVDGNSYLAKMGQGARGAWLFQSVYTSEPHDGAFVFILYILLGKIAALLPGDAARLPLRMIWVFHLARLGFSAVLLCTVYRFVAYVLHNISERRLAWLMVTAGGGLGWVLVAAGHYNWLGSMPLDFVLPEGFTFLTVFTLPHIALARALLLEGLLVWLRIADTGDGWPTVASVFWLAMTLIVPFYPLVVGLVLGGTLVLRAFVGKLAALNRNLWQLVIRTAAAGTLPGIVVLYTIWVFSANPIMRGWSEQNLVLSPHPLHYLVAYGLPGLFALLGVVSVTRQIRSGTRSWAGYLLLAWVIVIPPFLYFPFNLQRRLVESFQVPLCVLSAIGIAQLLWPRLRSRMSRPQLAAGLLGALMAITPVLLIGGGAITALSASEPVFHQPGQVAVARWLDRNALRDDVVLCDQPSGNFLPAWAAVRAFVGHGSETIDAQTKQAAVERFFGSTDDVWHQELLRTTGIDFVLYGPDERLLGSFDPSKAAYLAAVFSLGNWDLYEVVW
jgi:hypothetical protein